MTDNISVEFEYNGHTYSGYLGQPYGVGTKVWHLSVKGYHWGQLVIYMDDDWRMTSNQHDLLYLSSYFRDVVINWYQ